MGLDLAGAHRSAVGEGSVDCGGGRARSIHSSFSLSRPPGRYRRRVAVRAAQRHGRGRDQSAFGHSQVGVAAD
jgi:hypothetical protein